jgi:RimJ/RimL family protein N-acetyltransferase
MANLIRLRAFRESDVPDLLEGWRDELMMLWSAGPADEAGAREWLEAHSDSSGGEQISWAFTDDSDRLLGKVS